MDFLCCCASCKPRYQRLVDAIYPRTGADSSTNSGNMQKLTFYSISHPEKLNRIGIYLIKRLSRDLYRQRQTEVKVAVDAMDQLLKSCHGSPSIGQFIESYLLMVQKLLETNDPQMEKLATDLFVRFSGIEEDAPSYHRQYDFFISKFSAMCHVSTGAYIKSQRFNGLRGLRGVIWKSASDDIHANIWEKQHMHKIIPSILFNFQEENKELEDQVVDPTTTMLIYTYPEENLANEEQPHNLALQCLRELFQKCNFGSLKSVLEPVFKHFDLHNKWDPPATFAVKTFKAILYSIQSQNSYFVIQELINHLEHIPNVESRVRIGIATVLSNIVSIAGTTIGPLLLAIFNSLLKQLRSSVEFQQSKQCVDPVAERTFQDTLINALGDFANALPDYQKVEIMMFTIGSIPTNVDGQLHTSDAFLQKVLVKTLLKVATKYKTFYLATVFTDAFLKTLLQLQLTSDPEVRLIAQRIFHTLLDRHDNQQKLMHLGYSVDVHADFLLSVEKCSRQDQLFMRRHVNAILSALYNSVLLMDDRGANLEEHADAILCSKALLCVEVGSDETVAELLRLAFALQQLALDRYRDFGMRKCAVIHNLVTKYLNLSSQLLSIPAFCNHVQQVIKARVHRGHLLLNIVTTNLQQNTSNDQRDNKFTSKAPIVHMESDDQLTNRRPPEESTDTSQNTNVLIDDDSLLFDSDTVVEALRMTNKETQRILLVFFSKKK